MTNKPQYRVAYSRLEDLPCGCCSQWSETEDDFFNTEAEAREFVREGWSWTIFLDGREIANSED